MDDVGHQFKTRPTVLVVGEWDRAEMRPIRHWLQSLGDSAHVRHSARLPQGTADDQPLPELVVVCQSWPDEFSSLEVSSYLGRWPLTQWVVCFGSWCDSDGRTRGIWPIGLRVPGRSAVSRLQHVWEIVSDGRAEPLPVTASRDEAFEFDAAMPPVSTADVES